VIGLVYVLKFACLKFQTKLTNFGTQEQVPNNGSLMATNVVLVLVGVSVGVIRFAIC